MALHVHRSERADLLLGALADVMSDPLADPMAAEVICVPSRGMERWISQGLAERLGAGQRVAGDGISANIEFPFPGSLVADIVARASGQDPRADPWINGESFWALLAAIDANMDTDWMDLVAGQIRSGATAGRRNRIRTARYVANLFTRYQQQRPEMIMSWAAGNDAGPVGRTLAGSAAWQAKLWREVKARLAVPSPAERTGSVCEFLATDHVAPNLELPERISAFGLTRLPAGQLQVLRALAQHRDVHLFILHPSPVLWDAVSAQLAAQLAGSGAGSGVESGTGQERERAQDRSAALVANPLLASWGRDARELQLTLTPSRDLSNGPELDHHYPVPHSFDDTANPTLLRRLQGDVRANRAPVGASYLATDVRPICDPTVDTSVQVHSCHGVSRQVQVLRDVILALLDADPTLEPRDIIIMCPDVESFAPQVHAVFGAVPQLRVRLADRALTQTNELISAVALLLEVLDSRVSATDVMSLLAAAPVRAQFNLSEDDLDRVRGWLSESGVRWGLDGAHRRRWNLQDVSANTWSAGLDRVIAGVAMTDTDLRFVGSAVPLDDVGSNDILLAGRLCEFLDRLGHAVDFFAGEFSMDQGIDQLTATVDQLMATTFADTWQRQQLTRILTELRPPDDAVTTGPDTASRSAPPLLNVAEFADLLDSQLVGRPTTRGFRTGHITVCTLTPMRSIPHRIVCLLGLDEQAFPRTSRAVGDDLTQDPPFVGDQDGRGEDRQLLLDAVLAATDSLVITYSGHDERTNTVKPPSVPLAELLSVVDRTVRIDAGRSIVVVHPLQAFDPRNFTSGQLVPDRAFSYDESSLPGAVAQAGTKSEAPAFLSGSLPDWERKQERVTLADLVRFVEHPVKAFVRTRLGISLEDYNEALSDDFSLSMDSLADWAAGERVIEALSDPPAGSSEAETGLAWFTSEMAGGQLPPGEIVHTHLRKDVYLLAAPIAQLAVRFRQGRPPRTVPVRLAVGDDGRLVTGSVSGVYGTRLVLTTFSKLDRGKGAKHALRGKQRIGAWMKLLALAASDPDTEYCAYLIGRDANEPKPLVLRLDAPQDPVAALAGIVELYDRGMSEPLPLYCDTSAAYAETVARNRHRWVMSQTWPSGYKIEREEKDPYHELALSPVPTLDDLLEDADFIDCAHALWDPLLAHESTVDVGSADGTVPQ